MPGPFITVVGFFSSITKFQKRSVKMIKNLKQHLNIKRGPDHAFFDSSKNEIQYEILIIKPKIVACFLQIKLSATGQF